MMISRMTKSMNNVAMNESGMMDKIRSGAWRVARNVILMVLLLTGMVSITYADFTWTDNFNALANGDKPDFGYWNGANGSDGTNGWVALQGATGTGNTGPSATTGSDRYVYLETSADTQTYGVNVTTASEQYLESDVIDASQEAVTLDYQYHMWGMAATGCLYVEGWNGSAWTDAGGGSINCGSLGDQWNTGPQVDFSSYNNSDFKIRFRFHVSDTGNVFANDIAFDDIVITGTTKCTPTTGPISITGGNLNGDTIDLCSTFNLNGGTLTNIDVASNTGSGIYSGSSCVVDVSALGWTDGEKQITVDADDPTCGTALTQQTGTFNYSSCVPTTGPLVIPAESILYGDGSTADITGFVNDNGATVSNYTVSEVIAGTDIDDLMEFEGGGNAGFGADWTATDENGTTAQANPPENGDLQTGTFTRTENTGPSAPVSGSFVFYEASQTVSGTYPDRYLVHNDPFDTVDYEVAIEFDYHMYGANIGTLELQARNPSRNGGAWTTEFSASGNLGDVWQHASIDLHNGDGLSATLYNTATTDIRFLFRHSGAGPEGDIALDKVHVTGSRHPLSTLFSGNYTAAQTADTSSWPSGQELRLDVTGTDDCGGALSTTGYFDFEVDSDQPMVLSFGLPDTSVSPVTVYTFSGTDATSPIAGYIIIETPFGDPVPSVPTSGAAGWTASPPATIIPSALGPYTYYAWVKDSAGNVSSNYISQTVDVATDSEPPTVTQFAMPASAFSPIPVTSLFATDNSGHIAGYMVTESATPPTAGDAGWTVSPPTRVTTASSAVTTFYAWAKDSSGNVSAAASVDVEVKVDSNAPVVTFVLPGTVDSNLTIVISQFTAVDNVPDVSSNTGVTGYMITTTSTPPAAGVAGWMGSPPTELTVDAAGTYDFWAWAKDTAGNVSTGVQQTVTVNLTTCDYDVANGGSGAAAATYVDAEHFTNATAPNPWVMDVVTGTLADNSGDTNDGSGYLSTTTGGTGTQPNGSRHDYPMIFDSDGDGIAGNSSATYCIWIRALDQAGTGGGDSTFWGVDGTSVGAITQNADNQWAWDRGTQNGSACTTITDGVHTINLWPREAGQKTDAFVLTTDQSANAGGIFTGDNDQTATKADLEANGVKVVDPTCVDSGGSGPPGGGGGGGSGYVYIPDGQSIAGNPIDPENLYETDLSATGRLYRALGAESDGFNSSTVDGKWFRSFIGNQATAEPRVVSISGDNMIDIDGRGTNIWGTNDQFTYVYQPNLSGDFTVEVLVHDLAAVSGNLNGFAKAGVMVRQSLATNSAHATALLTGSNGAGFYRRTANGNNSANNRNTSITSGPVWVRLVRSGNSLSAYFASPAGSANNNWTQIGGAATINFTDPVNVGLAVTSTNTGADAEGIFDDFLFMPANTSGMSANWVTTPMAGIDTTDWTDGDYALSVRSLAADPDVEPETNTFTFSSCVDATPSTITVHAGATVGGSAVSLNSLFDHTGNAGNFTYQINGVDVNNPWNSYALVGPGSTGTATLRVAGHDPDCSGTTISDSAVINIDNSCSDPDPSTITILTGQTVGGPNVDLTKLFTYTGDVWVSGFTYKINGTVVGDPTSWDSRQYGVTDFEGVTLEISGTDPDCGNDITAINTIEVDNTCVRNPPSISFDVELGHVGSGRALPYQVTIRNEDSFNCGSSAFTVNVLTDSNLIDFESSDFNPVGSNINIVLKGRETAVVELAVKATSEAREWYENDTTLQITSSYGGVHNSPKTEGTVKTKVFLVSPITHNSVTTHSTKWGGNWGTSEAGSKYGNFTCLTCHDKGGPNIKWMRGSIATPDGSDWGISGSNELLIEFHDARSSIEILTDGDPDDTIYWGHDDPGDYPNSGDPTIDPNIDTNGDVGRNASNRVCEVCHSTTWYHRYDTQTPPNLDGVTWNQQGRIDDLTGQPLGLDGLKHFPDRDCTDCHRHSLGFTASCTGCHGDPPLEAALGGPNGLADIPAPTGSVTPGTHYKHTVVLGFPCEYCHAGWREVGEMPKEVAGKQQINHQFNVFYEESTKFGIAITDPLASNGHYTGQDGVNYTYDPALEAAGLTDANGTVLPGKGTMTCENIYCHGGAVDDGQPDSNMGGSNPQWNGTLTCNSCHGTSATNTPPGYSHTTHVGKMGLDCTVCHFTDGNDPGYNGHVNGHVEIKLDLASANLPVEQGVPLYNVAGLTYTDYFSNRDGNDIPPSAQYGTCMNISCHYYKETPIWNDPPTADGAQCTTCHNNGTDDDGALVHAAPNSGNHMLHTDPPAGIAKTMIDNFVGGCESCHGGGSNDGSHAGHVNGQTDLGGGMTYNGDAQTCTSQCHDLSGVSVNDSGTPLNPCDDIITAVEISWGSSQNLDCSACHKAPYIGPTVVDPDNEGTGMASAVPYGSHLKTTTGQTFSASTNWTVQCRECHPYHQDEGLTGIDYYTIPLPDAAFVNPSTGTTDDMQYILGLQYTVTGGIHLGGCSTQGTEEANICWNCHDTNGDGDLIPGEDISEWGGMAYDGYTWSGTNTKSWQSTTFNAPGTRIPNRATVSIHTANVAEGSGAADRRSSVGSNVDGSGRTSNHLSFGGTKSLEADSSIRCSYCHDLHDLNRAIPDQSTGDYEVATGAPYLRGSWLENPYPLERPPESTDTYGQTNQWNPSNPGTRSHDSNTKGLPRLLASSDASKLPGGFFIDENSGNPTSAYLGGTTPSNEVTQTAGICTLCHGTNVDDMDYYASSLWRDNLTFPVGGTRNGHSNSTLGGTGTNASDIFDAARGVTEHNTFMAAQDGLNNNNYGDSGSQMKNNGPFDTAMRDNGDYQNTTNPPPRNIGWYGGTELTTGRTGDWANWFGADSIGSSPSASGRAHDFSCSKCHTPHASGLPALLITNCLDRDLSNWTNTDANPDVGPTQQTGIADRIQVNCHRKDGTTTGWNRLERMQ